MNKKMRKKIKIERQVAVLAYRAGIFDMIKEDHEQEGINIDLENMFLGPVPGDKLTIIYGIDVYGNGAYHDCPLMWSIWDSLFDALHDGGYLTGATIKTTLKLLRLMSAVHTDNSIYKILKNAERGEDI